MAVVGYVRVSTIKQDTDNQKSEIQRWGDKNDTAIDDYVCETISSKKSDREVFKLVDTLKEGDILIATELSRLARSLIELLKIIEILTAKKIRVIIIKERIDVNDDDPMGMLTINIVGAFAQFERSMISKRTKEAIASKKAAGISVGRIEGSKNKAHKLMGKEGKIKEYIDKGMKKSEIAKLLEVSRPTLYSFLDEIGVKSDV